MQKTFTLLKTGDALNWFSVNREQLKNLVLQANRFDGGNIPCFFSIQQSERYSEVYFFGCAKNLRVEGDSLLCDVEFFETEGGREIYSISESKEFRLHIIGYGRPDDYHLSYIEGTTNANY